MKLAEGIRKVGFRKWYERELLTGHAHLALLLMCVLGLMTALEASSRYTSAADRLTDLVAVLVCAAAGVWTLRRYLFLLARAEARIAAGDRDAALELLATAAGRTGEAVTAYDLATLARLLEQARRAPGA